MSRMELLVLEMRLLGVVFMMKPAVLLEGSLRSMNIFPSGTFWTSPDQGLTFSSRMESNLGVPLRVAEMAGLTSSISDVRTEAMLMVDTGSFGEENKEAIPAPRRKDGQRTTIQRAPSLAMKVNTNRATFHLLVYAMRLHDVERGTGGKL